ncbi:MAG: hypothetical protein K2Q18_07635, partial [Bdellovibrionales bacterium]|nr:hypothetical protein [Bdellovibrionales bacterium]
MKFTAIFFIFIFTFSALRLEAEDSELNCAQYNHPAHQDKYEECKRAKAAIAAKKSGKYDDNDCFECAVQQETPESSGVLQALQMAVQPAAYVASLYFQASYQQKSQKAWADAYASGQTQCTARYNTYVNYLTASGANQMSSTENAALSNSCNGYGMGGYAGFGGMMGNMYGGYSNPYQAMGYSSGFLGAYGGPYANMQGSMYNTGMLSGSMGISG